MNRIRPAAPDWALDSMQMAAVFVQLHFGYKNRQSLAGGPRSCLTPISAGILLISIGAIISQTQAHAQTVSIPSAATTVTLQTLSPGSTTFDAPAATVISASSGDGIDGSNAQNWVLSNHGSITGAVAGISLSSAALNGVTLDNFSSIRGNTSTGVLLSNGGQLTNHAGATIAGTEDGVKITGAGATVSNDGSITTSSSTLSGVYFESGGTLTQGATGTIGTSGGTGYGVVFNTGRVDGTNAGAIYGGSANYAFWARGAAAGAFSNSGIFSAGTGAVLASNGVSLTNTGTITGTGGTAVSVTGNGNTLILGTGSVLNGGVASTGTNNVLTLQGSGSAGSNLTGFNTLNMSGTAWTLSGANTTTGTTATATNVQSGVLTLAGALTNGGAGGGTTIASGATLQVGNGGTAGSVTGNIVDNGSLVFDRSNAISYAALISGTGSLTQSGTGNLTLSTANTYTGATAIQAGRLTAGIANVFASSSAVTVNSGAIFALNNFAQTVNNLSGAGSVTLGSATLTVNNSSDTNLSGLISGTGGLTKTGSNALTLSGAGNSVGAVSVNAGSLNFAQSGLLTASSLTVANGAFSHINAGAEVTTTGTVTVAGTLASDGILNSGAGMHMSAGSTLEIGSTGVLNRPGEINNVVVDVGGAAATTIINNGVINTEGSGAAVKVSAASAIANITNTGSIGTSTGLAAVTGIWSSLGVTNIVNRGAVYGGSTSSAIYFSTSGNSLTLGAGSNLHGGTGTTSSLAAGVSSNAAAISAGTGNSITLIETGSENGDFLGKSNAVTQGFSGLTAATGSIWSLGGRINLIGTAANTLSVNGALTVTGEISNSGTGGGTTIANGGVLNLGNGGTSGGVSGNFIDNGTLNFNRSDVVTLANAISGTGTVTQAGTGTTILTGANTYTGGTTISAGALQIGNGGTTGSVAGNIVDNAALNFNHSDALTYGGVVSGTGSLTQQGGGTLVLTGDSSHTGGTTVSAGILQLGNGGTTGSVAGNITDNAALIFNRSNAATYGGVISGTGSLTQAGSGTTTLTGVNTYAGGTYFNAGILSVGADANLGSAAGGLSFNGGTLQFTSGLTTARTVTLNTAGTIDTEANADTLSGVVAGAGALTKQGTGTLILNGANTYTGGTNIDAGILQVGAAGTIGSGAANIATGGTLALIPAGGNYAFNNVLTGSGLLTATLGSATNSFNFGATVGNAFIGKVTLGQSTFSLAGANTSTLTNATLQLNAGNTTTVGAGAQSIGNLTLNGNTLIFANLPTGTLGTGVLTLNSGTVRVDPGSAVNPTGSLLTQDDGANTRLISATSVSGNASNLSLADLAGRPLASATTNIAQGGNTVAIGTYSFTLNTGAGTGLYAGYGLSQLDLQAGQTLTLAGDTTAGGAADMKARITGSGALTIDATNSITLINAANDYTGNTTVSGGTLVLGSDNALGNTALLALNAGTTADINGKTQAIGALGGAGTLNIDAGNLTINNGGAFGGAISGASGALNANGGTLILTGDSTYTGATTINAGTLQIGNGGTTGSYAGNITNNAVLAFDHSDTTTYGAVVSGTGSLTQQGSGTVVLTGDNTYTGGTAINAGTLQIGNGGTTGSVSGNITDNAALVFDRGDTTTYGGVVSGTGSLTQQGSGALVLTGSNTYTGGTTISAGTLQIGSGGTAGSVAGDITDNAALVFNRSDAVTYGGLVSGTGSLTQQGSGTTVLTAANTYSGGTTINAGTLELTGAGSIGSGTASLANAGTLLINNPASGNYTFNNALTGSGTLQASLGSGANTFTLGNTVGGAFTGTIGIAGGTFMLDNNAQSAMPNTTLRLDAGGLAQISANRTIGNLVFNGGTFQITSTGFVPDGKLAVGNLNVASGGAIALGIPSDFPVHALPPQPSLFDQDDNIELQLISATGTVTGAGSRLPLTKFDGSPVAAPQTVALSANGTAVAIASYNYATNVLAGANAGVWLGYDLLQLDLLAGQTLELTNANAVDNTLNARITGGGNLFIDAVNTAILANAASDYTGTTTVHGGTLVLGSNNALGRTAMLDVSAGATADINGRTQSIGALGGEGALNIDAGNLTINNGGTFGGVISGASGALNASGGTLILTGENTYTGATTINAGTLQIGDGGNTGSYAGNITDNAALVFDRGNATTYGGIVSGTGSLAQQGNGVLILTGDNTYTGGTTISAGTLQLGNGGTAGGIVGNVSNNAMLSFARSDNLTFDGIISGAGSVTQAGSGMVLFNGVQTYSGTTNINAGTLAIGDASHLGAELAGGGPVTVGAAGALGGYGKVPGP
ncbi:autotransporter-associated beta strand repeat-containing protein [Caballeronia sp. DA-9]|uniref:autotransporter-associated beta strand repeat-containing protein n=1 Tax=Caballeronia sp. DA-9 TaxID=3436237 RepID=UPI003F67E7E4